MNVRLSDWRKFRLLDREESQTVRCQTGKKLRLSDWEESQTYTLLSDWEN
jgi:hypothetical protein